MIPAPALARRAGAWLAPSRWHPIWRPDPELRGWHLGIGRLSWLAACLALVLAPHAMRLPTWISALFVLLCAWRLWKAWHGDDRLPPRWVVVFIALSIVPGVWVSYGTITGRQAGVALLALLAGIKMLETRGLRDAYVLSFLGFFLIITNFLFSQSIATAVYMLAVVVVMTATLQALGGGAPAGDPHVAPLRSLRRAGVLVAQAVPLMLVFFVLFPRIPGPIWGLPKDAHAGVTGLSDSMSPGLISSLSQSDAVAFRVEFRGRPPPPELRYWRGPVLTVTDGRRWTVRETIGGPRPVRFVRRGAPVDYEVTLEPHGARWLFALDLPAEVPQGARMTGDLQIRAREDVDARMRYRMRSYPHYTLEPQRSARAAGALALPRGAHPRARALARSWRGESGDPEAIVARALDFFATQGFVYTLEPPRLPGDAVDDFLFGTRQGFCEHYAGAFTVLMRAAGVPARVVTGYQGGEINPIGGHMVVRQRDAHAWTEVWIEGQGWVRVDPTSAVAPIRVESGIDAAIPPRIGPAALDIRPGSAISDALRRLRDTVDAAQAGWNSWVLGYGPSRQRELVARLGLDGRSYGTMVLALTVSVAALLVALALWIARRRGGDDPARACYERFCARLAARGLARAPHEGPRAYAARVVAERPELADAVGAVTDAYVRLRYAGAGDLRELARVVAAFRP